jgi:hypothetical protein
MSNAGIAALFVILGCCYLSHVSGQGWTQIPRGLLQVSGNLNYIWGRDKGNKIYLCPRPCTGGWKLIDGALTQLDVDDEFVWGVNGNQDIWVRPVDGSGTWKQIPGKLIHVSPSGNGYVWGTNQNNDVYRCKKPCAGGRNWKKIPGGLKMIDGGEREICGVSKDNNLFCRPVDGSKKWRHISAGFQHVTASGPYDIFAISTGNKLFRCRKPCIGQWIEVDHEHINGIAQCDATANALFGVDAGQSIWRKDFPL